MPEADPDTDDAPAEGAELSSLEQKLLVALRSQSEPQLEESIAGVTRLNEESVRGTLQRLRSKRLALVLEENLVRVRLTPRGEAALKDGLPERRLLNALRSGAGDAEGLSPAERSAAIGILRRHGRLALGVPIRLDPHAATSPDAVMPEETALASIARGEEPSEPAVVAALARRGLVRTDRATRRRWSASEEGRAFPLGAEGQERIGALTQESIASGSWREASFRPYDVRADVPFIRGVRPHPYAEWLEEFAEILVGLGFEEAEGPLVETEFWNGDVLFMPQDHPARSVHDVLYAEGLQGPLPPADLLARVAAAHEGRPIPPSKVPLSAGWTSHYDPELARRAVLRSQTTAVSARYLARSPTPPFRMFSIDRNFRFEALDARHHLEFGQCEGVIGEEGISIRELIGVFTELAHAIGIHEVKFRPSYFPFTEPSVEGYVRHPRLGWMEVFPGGIFRPEVLDPLQISVPVIAWGIGITRLAMTALGYNDIRELFGDDLGTLRGGCE